MNEQQPFWFHCGHCGSLFEADYNETSEHLCSECGQNPSVLVIEKNHKPIFSPSASAAKNVLPQRRESQKILKTKGIHAINKLIVVWLLSIALIGIIARVIFTNSQKEEKTKPTISEAPLRENIELLQKAVPKCGETLSKFLTAESMSERAELTFTPEQTMLRMAQFNVLNPPIKIDPKTLTGTGQGVPKLSVGRAIECQWESSEGQIIDSVFIEEADKWRLDWEHFVRYSDYSWPLFLAGDGPEEGEFRLLARKRFVDAGRNISILNIVFYAVAFGTAQEIGTASPEFLINKDTRSGKLLDAAFALEQSGKRPFGLDLKSIDPEGYIRVRVKIRRIVENNTRRFELINVVACHWYSTAESGIEMFDQSLEK